MGNAPYSVLMSCASFLPGLTEYVERSLFLCIEGRGEAWGSVMSKNNGLIKGGYILQPRAIEYSGAMKFPPGTREIWLYIIRRVQHKPFNKLKRGEGFFEYSEIQEALSWYIGYRRMVYSKTQVAKSLRRLREGNMIATTKATHGIVIKVCNYDYWQNPKHYEGNGEGHDEGNTKEMERPQYKQECIKNENNDNKKRGTTKDTIQKKLLQKTKDQIVYSDAFLTFWDAYPQKIGKIKAYDSFNKAMKITTLEKILDAVISQCKLKKHLRDNNSFCPDWPHPTTWLNHGRWDDEATIVDAHNKEPKIVRGF